MAKIENEIHFRGQIAQKALIEKDGRILLVQYPDDDKTAAGLWDLPGGRLNVDESPIDGVKREVREEIGAEIEVHGIITTGINVVTETFKLYVVVYRATLADPSVMLVAEEGEIGKLEWRDKKDILFYQCSTRSIQRHLKPIYCKVISTGTWRWVYALRLAGREAEPEV